MIKPLLRQKNIKNTPEPKSPTLFWSFVGAVICVSAFLLTTYIMQNNYFVLPILNITTVTTDGFFFILTSPGWVALIIFGKIMLLAGISSNFFNIDGELLFNLFIYGVSSIPSAFIGWMLFSGNKSTRAKGIKTFMVYIPLSYFAGAIIFVMAH